MNLSGCGDEFCLDKISMNKARAFNPFLCAKTDNLMALIAEVQVQMSGYEAYYDCLLYTSDAATTPYV